MKCSECTRRNQDGNQFCIYCGTALESSKHQVTQQPGSSSRKVILPPQAIDELIADRYIKTPHSHLAIHPLVVIILAVAVGLSGVYYWFFYQDTYQITAIDYEGTKIIDER